MLGDSYGAGIVDHLCKAELQKQDREREEHVRRERALSVAVVAAAAAAQLDHHRKSDVDSAVIEMADLVTKRCSLYAPTSGTMRLSVSGSANTFQQIPAALHGLDHSADRPATAAGFIDYEQFTVIARQAAFISQSIPCLS